ncbi:MAG TPA: hypothetical protein VJ728_15575 [Candidatus Binataceae bacterium]|nr:hypothetical protein [Candidatus Binataceae bacterium]
MPEIVPSVITRHAMPLIMGERMFIERLNIMIGTNQKSTDWLRTEDRETGVLEMEEKVAERQTGGAIAIGDNGLNTLQLAQG